MANPTLPIFNCRVALWIAPRVPTDGAADVASIQCQIYWNSRGLLDIQPTYKDIWVPPIFIRTPLGVHKFAPADVVLDLDHVGEYYKVRWTQRIHNNFPNEYFSNLVEQCKNDGTTPRV